jgi:hypothetical protein
MSDEGLEPWAEFTAPPDSQLCQSSPVWPLYSAAPGARQSPPHGIAIVSVANEMDKHSIRFHSLSSASAAFRSGMNKPFKI